MIFNSTSKLLTRSELLYFTFLFFFLTVAGYLAQSVSGPSLSQTLRCIELGGQEIYQGDFRVGKTTFN